MGKYKNTNLSKAKQGKNDEFYTQYSDIEKEMSTYFEYDKRVFKDKTIFLPCDDPAWSSFTKFFIDNFQKFGLKKLISTCIAKPSLPDNNNTKGKILTINKSDFKYDNLLKETEGIKTSKWKYLNGSGDFRTDEITALRDEADIIITNPPFSIFREFFDWVAESGKQFVIVGAMNAIAYPSLFKLIKANKLWLGSGFSSSGAYFLIPELLKSSGYENTTYDDKTGLVKFGNCCWFTNIEHGKRHEKLSLATMSENLAKNPRLKENDAYQYYLNYNAIEVPLVNAIPSDFDGVIGVPISYLYKHNPEQFEIIGVTKSWDDSSEIQKVRTDLKRRHSGLIQSGDGVKEKFTRILIKKKE